MIDKFYIDGKDAYSEYGVFVTAGGYDELACYPPLKSVASNDWQEEDGEEFDLASPVLDSRELSIKFASHGTDKDLEGFMKLLSNKAYHMFDFKQLGRTCKLRLVAQSNLSMNHKFETFTLRFADDFPLNGYAYKAPNSNTVPLQGYKLDDVDFAKYGVHILEGTLEEIEKSPAVKKNLLRNIASQSGVIYDGEGVTFETKDVKINCLMRADTIAEFWRNYDALLFDLIRPKERMLYVKGAEKTYPCYYKSCSVSEFYPAGKVWLKFSLNLIFTTSVK